MGVTRRVPVVGSQVYYYAFGTPGGEYQPGQERAAIVTEVDEPGKADSAVGLAVLTPAGVFFNRGVKYGLMKAGCWGWPPKL